MNDENEIRNGLQSIAADIDEHASPVTLHELGGSRDTAGGRRLDHRVREQRADDRVVELNPTTEPADGREPSQRRRVLVGAAAGLLVVAGVLGVFAVTRPTPSPAVPLTDPVRTTDPNGALFVLPEPIENYQLANGYLSTTLHDPNDPVETFAPNGVVVGVVNGAGYTDLRTITISETSPIGNTDVKQVDTSTGPAFISNDPITVVAQQRGSQWLGIATHADEQLALDMLDVISVDETNGIAVDVQAAGLVVIEDQQQRSPGDAVPDILRSNDSGRRTHHGGDFDDFVPAAISCERCRPDRNNPDRRHQRMDRQSRRQRRGVERSRLESDSKSDSHLERTSRTCRDPPSRRKSPDRRTSDMARSTPQRNRGLNSSTTQSPPAFNAQRGSERLT